MKVFAAAPAAAAAVIAFHAPILFHCERFRMITRGKVFTTERLLRFRHGNK